MKYALDMLVQAHNLLKVIRNKHLTYYMSVFEIVILYYIFLIILAI